MKILLLSPYHGGSHQSWAEGYQKHSQHTVTILSLPARFWKWRMHGGAVTLVQQFLANPQPYDLIVATDMLDLTTFLALTRPHTATTPTALYMHENQLTYPLPTNKKSGPMRRQKGERDLHYVFINYASMLAANHIFFNSAYHQNALLDALQTYLGRFPDHNNRQSLDLIAAKSTVLPVGIDFSRLHPPPPPSSNPIPLILWNQRWEYDKNPNAFFQALYHLQEKEIPFRLALCGENLRQKPTEFIEAAERLNSHIIHIGFADESQYRHLLWAADITISTAHHEFFGISILEAIHCQTFPLLPQRLSYPELIPPSFHSHCLYKDEPDLHQKLLHLMRSKANLTRNNSLAHNTKQYAWSSIAVQYDQQFAQLNYLK